MNFKREFPLLMAFWIGVFSAHAEDVVINEVLYNPETDSRYEFIELYNPTSSPVDLHGFACTEGIQFPFPSGAVIQPASFLLLVKDPTLKNWQTVQVPLFGPYDGKLANDGERLTLRGPDNRLVDSFEYADGLPWPRGADGYGPSLERISADLPSEDFHSWRASLQDGGTPGYRNSVVGIPPFPVIRSFQWSPPCPTSNDSVNVQVTLDAPERIREATLCAELHSSSGTVPTTAFPMALTEQNPEQAVFQCVIPPCPSQTLVRFYLQVALTDGTDVQLPPLGEPRPFESYFVYDNEIHAELPLLWIFPTNRVGVSATTLPISGIVVKPVTSEQVLVFDGARVEDAFTGQKIRFLKGEEFRGDRTINLSPGNPLISPSFGPQSLHVEHISYRLFRDFGVLAPRCDWYRVIENGQHSQRIAIQQPNERFLAINGRDDEGNIYKIAYNEQDHFNESGIPDFRYKKQTNTDEDCGDLFQMLRTINASSEAARGRALRAYLNVQEVMAYSVVSVFLANWDGFHNNMFLYHNPAPIDRWECVPWDLDQTFGFVPVAELNPLFQEIPLDYPLTGICPSTRRPPGMISKPFHSDSELDAAYRAWLGRELDGLLSEERIGEMIAGAENLLLSDLDLMEQHLRVRKTNYRQQMMQSYEAMRTFLRLQHEYLRSQLPVSIEDWQIH